MISIFKTVMFLCSAVSMSNGWLFPIKATTKAICRKGFLIGAAGGAVVGAASAAGAAVAVNTQLENKASSYYQPAADSMKGKVVLVTGGSTGLGLESAKRLAAAGATIVLTSRTLTKGEKAANSVKDYLNDKGMAGDNVNVYNLVLDLDDLETVKAFPESYKQLGLGNINVLLNNAGVMAIPDRQLTKDGYERTFQSNHLGHFVLTAGLYPMLSRDGATVINVSSSAYQAAISKDGRGLDLDNLNGEKKYGPWTSYGLSKLSNILFTRELQKRAEEAGDTWLTTVTLHPGAVSTDLARNLVGEEKWNEMKTAGVSPLQSLAFSLTNVFLKTVPEGASTQIFLASGADGTLKKAAFYEDLKVKDLPNFARDDEKAKKLWEKSEELGGITFDISAKEESEK